MQRSSMAMKVPTDLKKHSGDFSVYNHGKTESKSSNKCRLYNTGGIFTIKCLTASWIKVSTDQINSLQPFQLYTMAVRHKRHNIPGTYWFRVLKGSVGCSGHKKHSAAYTVLHAEISQKIIIAEIFNTDLLVWVIFNVSDISLF